MLVLPLVLLSGRALGQTCTTLATGLAFATYQPLTGLVGSSTATVTVTCVSVASAQVSFSIQLGPGGGGSFAGRSMTGAGGRLGYQIYTDGGHSQVWGDGTGGTSSVSGGMTVGVVAASNTYTAYGSIPAGVNVGVGTYNDSMTILVIY